MSREFDPGKLIEQAMEEKDRRRRATELRERSKKSPCPPDPELDGLFREFARRMSVKRALPLVEIELVEAKRRRREDGSQKRELSKQVGRGWPLIGKGQRIFSADVEKGTRSPRWYWKGMVVDTTGSLWFALSDEQFPYKASELVVGTSSPDEHSRSKFYSPGRPKGPNLREEIAAHTAIVNLPPGASDQASGHYLMAGQVAREHYDRAYDQLPKLIAEDIGVTLQQASKFF